VQRAFGGGREKRGEGEGEKKRSRGEGRRRGEEEEKESRGEEEGRRRGRRPSRPRVVASRRAVVAVSPASSRRRG